MNKIKLALLTSDDRQHRRQYDHPKPFFGTAPEALMEGLAMLPDEVEVHVVSCLQKKPAQSPPKLADNIFYHGLHIPSWGWLKTGYMGCTQAVRRKLAEIGPDIVHGQGTERDCAISAVRSGYPNVLTIHGNMARVAEFLRARPLSFYWLAARLERHCLRRTAGVVCISDYTRRNVEPYTSKTWLLPNAVHPSYFQIHNAPENPPLVLCVANIGSRKNQICLLESLDALRRDLDFRLCFAGAGSDVDPYFREFTQRVQERSWCRYAGSLKREDLQKELRSASLAILPSLEDNCPMVILEAAAAGVPMAASAIGGIPDLVQHEVNGLLFDPADPLAMRESVRRLLTDRPWAERLARAARERALAVYAPEVVARRHLEIYREVLAG